MRFKPFARIYTKNEECTGRPHNRYRRKMCGRLQRGYDVLWDAAKRLSQKFYLKTSIHAARIRLYKKTLPKCEQQFIAPKCYWNSRGGWIDGCCCCSYRCCEFCRRARARFGSLAVVDVLRECVLWPRVQRRLSVSANALSFWSRGSRSNKKNAHHTSRDPQHTQSWITLRRDHHHTLAVLDDCTLPSSALRQTYQMHPNRKLFAAAVVVSAVRRAAHIFCRVPSKRRLRAPNSSCVSHHNTIYDIYAIVLVVGRSGVLDVISSNSHFYMEKHAQSRHHQNAIDVSHATLALPTYICFAGIQGQGRMFAFFFLVPHGWRMI